jgi:hypothetical protein
VNEPTRELFRQALELVLNGQDPDRDIDKMYIPAVFVKRYTELLVKECCAQIGYEDAIADVKSHFGVK